MKNLRNLILLLRVVAVDANYCLGKPQCAFGGWKGILSIKKLNKPVLEHYSFGWKQPSGCCRGPQTASTIQTTQWANAVYKNFKWRTLPLILLESLAIDRLTRLFPAATTSFLEVLTIKELQHLQTGVKLSLLFIWKTFGLNKSGTTRPLFLIFLSLIVLGLT